MKRTFNVTFVQYYTYKVTVDEEEAPSSPEDAAIDEAAERFDADMRKPIARTCWDEVDVEEA